MRIHSEGYKSIVFTFLILLLINAVIYFFYIDILKFSVGVSVVLQVLILQFFRVPARIIPEAVGLLSPADGKILEICKVKEDEYFMDERLKISIFMSPFNVHLNRVPVDAKVVYQKYHSGKYLLACHPKSSLLNERNTIVLRDHNGREILLRQIAGVIARRIVSYMTEGIEVKRGDELGFIKFGSRVDVFLPPDTELNVAVGQKLYGNKTLLCVEKKNKNF